MQPHLSFPGFSGKRIHLGVTGSIAAYKALDLLRQFTAAGASVGVTLTSSAQQFVTPLAFRALGAEPLYSSLFDVRAPLVHLAPGQQAELLVIAPATANIIAKIAHGMCDDLLTTQILAFDGPLVVAPGMNQRMWNAQATQTNWNTLKTRGVHCIEPEHGPMACGEEGKGRLPCLETIMLQALKALSPQDLSGRRVLVSFGPTIEPWDPARFWSNPSTGTMGGALAVAAWLRGGEVTAVHGPVDLWLPEPIRRIPVTTALQMNEACMQLWPDMDVACMAAAVSDFSPVPHGTAKFKKTGAAKDRLNIEFTPNPDILAEMGRRRTEQQRLIGFAAETEQLEDNARSKLRAKNLDLVMANRIGVPGSGFASATNEVLVLDRTGRTEQWPILPKTEIAWRLWDRISTL
jgi:phosphopantothenoylcysteine decarboxylase / phosphopantothenate---cysteine ligase